MSDDALTVPEVRAMLLLVAARIQESSDELTEADRAIGDGDHGLAMARGFAVARRELDTHEFDTVDGPLSTVGRALLSTMGGASGILFSAFFIDGAHAISARVSFGATELALFLADGSAAVQRRGNTTTGAKTMLDALVPAAQKANDLKGMPLAGMLPFVVEAARAGVEQTKTMVALAGKAKAMGDRSLGHADPGAVSVHLILRAMEESVSGRAQPIWPRGDQPRADPI